MPFVNHIHCPLCDSRIELSAEPALFDCRVCGCEFRHNTQKWFIGIPLVIVATIILWGILHLFGDLHSSALTGMVVSFTCAIFSSSPTYVIVSAGREFPAGARTDPPGDEVHWLVSVLLLMIIAGLLAMLAWPTWFS